MDFQKLMCNVQLMSAIENETLPEIANLLKSGADVNFINRNGKHETPLHVAVKTGNPKIIEFLLAEGANIHAKNTENKKSNDLISLLDGEKRQAVKAVFVEHFKKTTSKTSLQQTHLECDSTIKSYTKRAGTSALGQFYEIKLLTMMLFRLLHDDQIKSFYLGNNLDEAGAFDDIVLRSNGGGKSRVVCLQAKHKKAEHVIEFEDIIGVKETKGDFLIKKYFESFLKILYMFDPKSNHVIFQGNFENIELELIIFTPAILNYNEVQCEHTSYSRIFYCENKPGKSLRIRCDQDLLNSFVSISQDWHKKVITEILARLMLLHNYDTSDPQKAIEELKENNILNNDCFNCVNLLKLFHNQNVMQVSVKTMKKLCEDIAKLLVEPLLPSLAEHFMIVEKFFEDLKFYAEQATENELDSIIKNDFNIKNYESVDLMLSKSIEAVESWWKQVGQVPYQTNTCTIFKVAENELKLEQIHFKCLDKIKYNVVKFRRKEAILNTKFINLNKIIQNEEHVFLNIFSSTLELCCVKIIQYLQWYKICFKVVIIDKLDNDHLLEIFSTLSPKYLILAYLPEADRGIIDIIRQKVKKLLIITKQNYEGDWRSISDETNSLLDFESECQEKLLESQVTFQGTPISLRMLVDEAPKELIDAKTIQKLICGKDVVVSKTCPSADNDDSSEFYIERLLFDNRNQKKIAKSIMDIPDGVIVVAAEPGMGKSTLLTGLTTKIKQSNPSSWVIRINLLDYTSQFNSLKEGNTILNRNVAFRLLVEATIYEKCYPASQVESFERKIFQWYCEQDKIVLLIDGFDEISPDYTTIVLELLQIYKNNFTEQLWVTTRIGGDQKELEKSLSVHAYTLEPFTMDEIIFFLLNFWRKQLRIGPELQNLVENYVHQLVTHLTQSLEYKNLGLINVPLQIKMIAMIFQEKLIEFCSSPSIQFNFNKLDLVTLYEQFIDLKFNVILMKEKNKTDITKPSNKKQLKDNFEQFKDKHKKAGIYYLFNKTDREKILCKKEIEVVEILLQEVQHSFEKTGIITRVVDANPIFVHQSYAEFFAALFIWEKYSSLQITNPNANIIPFFSTKGKEYKRFIKHVLKCLFEGDRVQIAKFLYEIAKNKIKHCFDSTFKANVLLQKMLEFFPVSWKEYNRKTFAFLLGIIEWSIVSDIECFMKLNNTIKGIADNKRTLLLLKASECGYICLLQLLIKESSNCIDASGSADMLANESSVIVNSTFDLLDGWTALHFAANCGHTNVVELLIRNTANVNRTTAENGQTALHMAVGKGNCEMVQLLLNNGADINSSITDTGVTPLHLAAREGFSEIVSLLLTKNAVVDCETTVDGETPLHIASGNGHLKVVQLLIEHGAKVDLRTRREGSSALHFATKNGHLPIVRVLLEKLSDPNIGTTDFNFTPLHWAARDNFYDIASLLIDKNASIDIVTTFNGHTPLFVAVSNGHFKIVQLLLEKRANVNIGTEDDGMMPLHVAARKNYCEIAKALLEKEADIDSIAPDFGGTPLQMAMEMGHLEMVQLLIGMGANVNVTITEEGLTTLHWAARNNFKEIVSLLLEKGADINSCTQYGNRTAICIANEANNWDIVRMLLDNGASVLQALQTDVLNGSGKFLKLLLDRGFDVDTKWRNDGDKDKDIDGYNFSESNSGSDSYSEISNYSDRLTEDSDEDTSILLMACDLGHTSIVYVLVDAGANVNQGTSRMCYMPLHYASRNGYSEIIKLLLGKGANINSTTTDGRTPLYEACKSGHEDAAKILLELGANANLCETTKDITPLHCAAQNGSSEIIKLLVDKGANINCTTTDDGRTPLLEACRKGHADAAKMLLEFGANVHLHETTSAATPLHYAARNDCSEIIKLLVDMGADMNSATIDDGRTPLYEACKRGHKDATNILLNLGANANLCETTKALTPLHCAARKGYSEIIKLLLYNGATINCTTSDGGRTPLLEACESGHEDVAKMLLEFDVDVHLYETTSASTCLHWAARNNCLEVIKLLLNKGANINSTTTDGRTPLYEACRSGHEEAAIILLEAGANANLCETTKDITPLHCAAQNGSSEIIKLLVDKGANINCTTTDDGRTPLLEACRKGHADAAKMLLEFGANVHLFEKTSAVTPLHYAARNDCSEIIKLLIDKGANMNCATLNDGRTPLYEACKNGHEEAAKMLLILGAYAHIETTDIVYTPLHLAARLDCPILIKLLIEKGVDINCITAKYIRTPLFLASQMGSEDAVKMLLDMGADVNQSEDSYTPLHTAAYNNHPEVAKLLIQNGAIINSTTTDNARTPLYEAAKLRSEGAVEMLLKLGASNHLGTCNIAHTPLHCAARRNYPNIIKLLVNGETNINCTTTDNGRTPLFLAAQFGAESAVKVLLKLGASVNLGTSDIAYKPLHIAAWNNFASVVDLLCEAGADVNCRTLDDGRTPLHEAANRGFPSVVKVLLKHGANTNIKTTNHGLTALDYAAEQGVDEIVDLLSERTACSEFPEVSNHFPRSSRRHAK